MEAADPEQVTEMESECRARFEIMRATMAARGIEVPPDDTTYRLYKLGFCDGGQYAIDVSKGLLLL